MISRTNIVKIDNLSNTSYSFMAVSSNIPVHFFTEYVRSIHNFICKKKKTFRISKAILNKKRAAGSLTITDFNFSNYYRATTIKTTWYWSKGRQLDQWN